MSTTCKTLPFPVTLQTVFSHDTDPVAFAALLAQLEQLGFSGIELNLPELDLIPPQHLLQMLAAHHLRLTWLATGAYAKKRGLSLCDPDHIARAQAIEGCKRNLDYAAQMGCGIILGFFKSNPAREPVPNEALLVDSLRQICAHAQKNGTSVLLEATNRYESRVANTVAQTAAIVRQIGYAGLGVLPDTFHMNIEEARPMDALQEHFSLFSNLHISDNNRYFPGYGAIDFATYLNRLAALGYTGALGIEGNLLHSLTQDIAESASYLSSLYLRG